MSFVTKIQFKPGLKMSRKHCEKYDYVLWNFLNFPTKQAAYF